VKTIPLAMESASYDIRIGVSLLDSIETESLIAGAERIGLIVSRTVFGLHRGRLERFMRKAGKYELIEMDDGEENKNYRYAERFFEWMLARGFTRKSVIFAAGGGVVGDFAGYCAALFMRGVPVVHIPTTLLAMVDSSIGGKVAVNISAGKNIVGAFYQPCAVVEDISFLSTLPDDELKNGIAETVKHAFLGEQELLDLLLAHDLHSIRNEPVMEELIFRSAGYKAGVVGRDEREAGLRAILNFGHTAGHAIESVMEYRGISHGEAVAVGLRAAMAISRRMGYLDDETMRRFDDCIERYGLAGKRIGLDPSKVISHMKYDKKNFDGRIQFVLLKAIGSPAYNQPVDEALLADVIAGLV